MWDELARNGLLFFLFICFFLSLSLLPPSLPLSFCLSALLTFIFLSSYFYTRAHFLLFCSAFAGSLLRCWFFDRDVWDWQDAQTSFPCSPPISKLSHSLGLPLHVSRRSAPSLSFITIYLAHVSQKVEAVMSNYSLSNNQMSHLKSRPFLANFKDACSNAPRG